MGEVRGSFDSTDSRDHLHSGLDVSGTFGEVVRAIRSDKVTSPLPNGGFNSLSEGLRIGFISYIHMHVGRDKDGKPFEDPRFVRLKSDDGKLARLRVRRGTRFRPGDALGTVNRMYHVHLIVGPSGAEINPLSLSPVGLGDKIAPTIERDGISTFVMIKNCSSPCVRCQIVTSKKGEVVVAAAEGMSASCCCDKVFSDNCRFRQSPFDLLLKGVEFC